MNVEAALVLADTLIFTQTGKHLTDLQSTILQKVWQGQTYIQIADEYSCTEGHVKDVASLLWKLLTIALGEKVTKSNVCSVLKRKLLTQSENKFTTYPTKNVNFVGRKSEITHLFSLVERGHKVIVIQGEGGIGKTTLAQQYFKHQEFELVLELLMAKETQNITSVESVIEEWLKKDLQEEPGREFGITLGRLKRHLETRRIGIIIDNIEPALDAQGMLIPAQNRYVELLRVLTSQVQCVTLITSRDRICEPALNLYHYRLFGLDLPTWERYFYAAAISLDFSTLQAMQQTYGGNPKAMGILCGVIQTDFAGNMREYWQEIQDDPLSEIDLKNLVASQFERLQNLDINAYKLLCRLGCYRYQDIPKLSRKALLALLWDIDITQRKRVIQSLQNRSLIEYNQGQYWLHPVIRAEAITRLRCSQEWQQTNVKAAEFWTESVKDILTLQDGITAWEALYHYLEIKDFEQASQVILQPRKNQWGQFLPLGSIFYRMGLLQPVLRAILQIIEQVKNPYHRSELYNILGDLYWITGNIRRAITCQEETINITVNCLKETRENQRLVYYLKMLEIDSLLSIGLYQSDLWELEKAIYFLNQVIDLAQNTPHFRWAQKALICLALVKSYLGNQQEALLIADSIYSNKELFDETGRFAYFIQILGQTYVNLGEMEKAIKLLQSAIAFSQESHYPQIRAKALISLAEVERRQKKLYLAITKQLEAINILEEIGAKCDLAESYYQLGLTQQQLGENYNKSFEKAIQLFREIEAPRQIHKVQEANNLL
ncbi:NB-ARC domain-containing protein [Aphanothece hegewaldii CCALA 016]|uniref:NB-ARC domain-containing protein n=1 Tax=Aphanothece hegewaldii CCALA 016 TaxID=2107694 RepID=A0A2T1M3A2_9CHRO|nr:ATP-binding protein [Aphanothece hegewaldii]PSF39305.1 NB-ARC domain-containing protein [Aphanothece hegewaldii CCALA 016]